MDGFVDDTSIIWQNLADHLDRSYPKDRLGKSLEQRRQHNGALHATGGQLELPKCFYYSIGYSTPKGSTARNTRGNKYPDLLRQSGRSRRRRYSDVASTSHRTLGVRENPSEILHEHLDSKGKENVTP
jgi:hypothetical protein